MDSFSWQTVMRIAFVYALVSAVAAGIAYLANQLGRQIGKRKMSVLHLRPRHTSILITTVTGVAIALITLTVFACLSEPVRTLLIGLEKLRTEETQLRQNIMSLQKTLAEGSFIWRIDEPIVHMTIPGGLSYERTRAAVTSLLAEANVRTIMRTNSIAAEKGDKPIPVSDVLIDYDPEQVEDMISSISAEQGFIGLRVLASQNSLYAHKAPLRLESWKVRKVFSEGEIVSKREMDNQQAGLEFLKFIEDTRQEAISKGMRPIDGELGGELNSEDFERLQKDISREKGKFEVVAVANRDLYETSSLDIRVEVHSLEPQSNSESYSGVGNSGEEVYY
ncbi:MAG: DUF3084 domain-containing protein [Candidatus Bruticola sp.]